MLANPGLKLAGTNVGVMLWRSAPYASERAKNSEFSVLSLRSSRSAMDLPGELWAWLRSAASTDFATGIRGRRARLDLAGHYPHASLRVLFVVFAVRRALGGTKRVAGPVHAPRSGDPRESGVGSRRPLPGRRRHLGTHGTVREPECRPNPRLLLTWKRERVAHRMRVGHLSHAAEPKAVSWRLISCGLDTR